MQKKKTTSKRKKYRKTELTGYHAEKCEVCGAQVKHLYKMGIFELLFCPKHYKLWLQGLSIQQMREREAMSRSRKTTIRKRTIIPIMKQQKARREFTDKHGRHWFDDGFEIWSDDYSGDDEPFDDRDSRYADRW